MKNLLLFTLSLFLLYQCADKGASTNGEKSTLKISATSASDYQNLKKDEKAQSPIARLCAESKGYRKDEWDALNECSWAVEIHQMKSHKELARREGGQLFLNFVDSTHILTHQADEYYQFVDYLPDSKYYIIRVLRPLTCPMYWLMNSRNNEKIVLPGEPILSEDKQSFMLSSSSDNQKINCPNGISYWAFKDNKFQELGFLKHKKSIQDLLWKERSTWLGKEGKSFVSLNIQ